MPVRSRGSLLAGTAIIAGLLLAGLGCHSSPSDHDSFSIPQTPTPPPSNLLAQLGGPGMATAYPTQPVVPYGAMSSSAPPSGAGTLHPVPMAQAPTRREVIASTWQPVRRVSAEQTISGPEVQEAPIVAGSVPLTPAHLSAAAPMPVGMPQTPTSKAPPIDSGDAAAPDSTLPPPRALGSLPSAVVYDGVAPPHQPHNVPREFEKMALPPYVVEPPDVLLIQASNRITLRLQAIEGQHLVAPDGTVNLGIYGKIRVAGMTLEQVADAVASRLLEIMPGLLRGLPDVQDGKEVKGTDSAKIWKDEGFTSIELIKKELQVDVLIYSSKFYYVITDGGGYGQQVYPIPIRGNETVLDALANVNGLPSVANKRKIWVARATRAGQPPKILPVDWLAVAKCGQSATNYQLFPGDRVYVDSSGLIKADTFLSKLYSPFLRTFGITLLGTATVNSIKNGTSNGLGGLGGLIR